MEQTLERDLIRYVPKKDLISLVKISGGASCGDTITKKSLVELLDALLTKTPKLSDEIISLIRNYKFAGKTSVSWSVPVEETCMTRDQFEKIIIDKLGSNPFENELKPEPTNLPSLNKADWLKDDLLRLEFVYIGRSQLLEVDYDYQEIWPITRANVLIRILNSSFVIESRAEFNQSRRLHNIVSDLVGVKTNIIEFSETDIERIKSRLNAKKKSAKHKKFAGDFDTVDVTAAPSIEDLDESHEYLDYLSTDEISKVMYKFNYDDSDGGHLDVTIRISKKGSIWFVNMVPEDVVSHVFSCIGEIKRI